MTTSTRTLGPNGPELSAIGLGCWAIGGPFLFEGKPDGWGAVNDTETIRAVNRAVDLGVTLFDTADVYGTGRSERVLGRALRGRRDEVVIATKFGYTYDESLQEIIGTDLSPSYIRRACAASLTRLETDRIDLYQVHVGEVEPAVADDMFATLEDLVDEGKIRGYGWSTEDTTGVRRLAGRERAVAVQFPINVLDDSPDMLAVSAELELTCLARTPLAMGLLTGKFDAGSRLPADDVRGSGHSWVTYFRDGRPDPDALARLAAVREILTSEGRTLAQGALAWVMARSDLTVPIPGFKSLAQVEDNAGALDRGPLSADQLAEIDELLDRRLAYKG